MTETQWLGGKNYGPLLNFVETRVSERKLRLFACAVVRLDWSWLTDERSRRAIEIYEAHADGAAQP
jgi:hypothetical protein